MKKADLENRIKELEQELRGLKSVVHKSNSICNDQIAESKNKFQAIAECIPAFLAYVNAFTLKYEYVNDLYVKSFGIPKEKIIGSHIKDVIGETNFNFALKYINLVKAGKSTSYENVFHLSSGKRWLQVNYSPVFDESGHVAGLALVNFDITERKISEENLKKSEERFRTIFEVAPIGVALLDSLNGHFYEVNPMFAKIAGRTVEHMASMDWMSITHPDDIQEDLDNMALLNSGKINGFQMEKRYLKPDGTIVWIHMTIAPLYSFESNPRHLCMIQDITERKQFERDLITAKEKAEEGEHKLKVFSDTVTQGVALNEIVYDENHEMVDYRILEVNRAFFEVADYSSTNVIGNVATKLYGMSVASIKDFYHNHKNKKDTVYTDFQSPISKKWFYISTSPFENNRFVTGFMDITSIKNSECELLKAKNRAEESEKRFKAITEQAMDGIALTDLSGNYVFVNPAFCKMVGYTEPELLKMNVMDLKVPSESSRHFNKLKQEGINSDSNVKLLCKDKSVKYVELNAQIFEINNEKLALGIMRDITLRVKAESELILAKERVEESEEKYKLLHENAGIGIGYFNTAGVILSFNRIAAINMGGVPADFIGKSLSDFFPKQEFDIYVNRIQKATLSEEPMVYEDCAQIPNQKRKWFLSTFAKIANSRNEVLGIQVISQDITNIKNAEIELQKAKDKAEESDRLKSAFLANMSHEIRTPMNGILGFAELLKEPRLSFEEQQQYIFTIEKSGARLLSTINSIINISKIEAGHVSLNLSETNINEKIEFTYKFFKPEVEAKGLQLVYRNGLTRENSVVKSDNEKIYGILTNLIKNAIKFTDKGTIDFGYEKKEDFLEFYVKDTGKGISAKQLEYIFDRFRQGSEDLNRNYEGSGLGLTIAKSYVEMLGGRIYVESQEGKGSTFYFTIPFIPVSEVISENKISPYPNQNELKTRNLRILIVEDDEISHSLLSKGVKKISTDIFHAITGKEAVEICQNNPDIDVVLMDIRMPVMNGIEATKQIRQFNKDVIIIAQTAYGFESDSEKALAAGCNDYISKPIDIKLLTESINKNLGKH